MALRKKLELDITQYRRRLDEAKREARRFSREATQSADRMQDGMTDAADESARGWQSAGDRIQSTLRGLAATIAAVFSVQAIRSFAERLINANREIEDASARLRAVVDDDRAPALLESIREFTARTPFAITEVTNAFALLVGSGLDAERMIQTVADTAAASGRSIEDAARAVGDAMQGQVSRLRDLGVGIRRIEDDTLQVFNRMGEAELFQFDPSDQRSFQRAVQSALEASFDGAAERLSQTVSGRLSTLADVFRDELAEAGEPLFEAFGTSVDTLTSRLRDGDFTAALQRMGQVVAAIFQTMQRLASTAFSIGPSFIAAGAALAGWKAVEGIVGPFQAIRRSAELTAREAQRSLRGFAEMEKIFQSGSTADDFLRSGGATERQANLITDARSAMHDYGIETDDVRNKTAAYQQTLADLNKRKSAFGNALSSLGGRLRSFAAALLSPQMIFAAIAGVITFIIQRRRAAARALEEMLRPIKEMREEAENLLDNIRRLEPSALVSRLRSIEIDLEINQDDLEEAEARLEEIQGQRRIVGPGADAEQIKRQEDLRQQEEQLTAEIEEREKAIAAQKEAQARAQTAVSRSVLATLEAKEQEIQREKETLELSEGQQEAVDNLNRARLAALDQEDTAQAAVIQAEIDRILDRATVEREAAEERIEALKEERDIIEARARALGLLDEDEPTTATEETTSEERRQQVAITSEFRRQLELLERQRGLRGRALDEAQAAADAQQTIWRLTDRRAQLQDAINDGTADSAEDAQAEIRALDKIIEGEEDRMALAERRQKLLATLSSAELALIEELGGLDAALSDVDFEDVLDFAPILQEMQRLTQQMEDEITRATAEGMAQGLSDEDVQKELDEIAKKHQESLKELLENLDLSSLPPQLVRLLAPFLSDITESADEASRLWQNLRAAGRSLRSLGRASQVLGVISRDVEGIVAGLSDAVMSAADFGQALEAARDEDEELSFFDFLGSAEGMTSAVGVVSGIASVVGSVLSARKNARERQERLAEQMEQLRRSIQESSIRIASAVDDFTRAARVGGGITGQQADQALDLLEGVRRFRRVGDRGMPDRGDDTPRRGAPRDPVHGPRGSRRTGQGDMQDDFMAFLEELMELDLEGIDASRFRDLFEDLLESGMGVRSAIERVMDSGLDDALRALEEDLLGSSVDGAIEGMELMQTFFGKDLPEAFDFFLSFLLEDVEGISEEAKALLEEARTLDISTADGRKRLEEIAAVFAQAALDRDTDFLEGLTPDEIQRIAETMLGAEVDERGVTRSTQVARAITEWQAAIVIDLLGEQVQTLHAIRDIIEKPAEAQPHPVTFGDIHITEASDGQKIAEELQHHINRKRLN